MTYYGHFPGLIDINQVLCHFVYDFYNLMLVIDANFLSNTSIINHVEMVQDLGPPGCCPPYLCFIYAGKGHVIQMIGNDTIFP